MKVDRVTANHSLSSTAIQQKFQHSLSLLSLSQDVTARQKLTRHSRLAAEKAGTGDNKREQETNRLSILLCIFLSGVLLLHDSLVDWKGKGKVNRCTALASRVILLIF